MNSYLFSAGDSTDGPVGFCIRVQAENEDSALRIARACVREFEYGVMVTESSMEASETGVLYFQAYFNPRKLVLEDIEDMTDDIDKESGLAQGSNQV